MIGNKWGEEGRKVRVSGIRVRTICEHVYGYVNKDGGVLLFQLIYGISLKYLHEHTPPELTHLPFYSF